MTTAQEREFIQIYRNADDAGKALIHDMLLCFAYCGEDFINEIRAVQEDKDGIKAIVAKYVATVKEGVAV